MKKLKTVTGLVVLAAGLVTPMVLQYEANVKLREENRALTEQTADLQNLDKLRAENALLTKQQSQATNEQYLELLRLRGEVGMLKKQLAEMAKTREDNARLLQQLSQAQKAPAASEALSPVAEQQKQLAIAKMNYLKSSVLSFILYAQDHNGQFPASAAQVASYFPKDFALPEGLQPDQYELVYQGSLTNITTPGPAMTIVIREKQAWQTVNGTWARAYGFADGHSEIHVEPTGNFQPWESTRMYPAR